MSPPAAGIVQGLRDAAATLPADRVPMQALVQAHGPAAQGTLLMLLAAPCLLPVPGVGTVLGLGLAAMAAAMWQGQAEACLPRRVATLELPHHWAQRVLGLLASVYGLAARHARARHSHLACAGRRSWIAATVGAMAMLIVLPIPFGNVLPALATMLFGLGLVFRDGVAMLLGLGIAALAVGASAGLVLLAWDWGHGWAGQLAGG